MSTTLCFLDKRWNDEPNRFNTETGRTDGKPPTHYAPGPWWLCSGAYGIDDYVDVLVGYLKRNTLRLNRLVLAAHGNAGQLFLGAGLTLENAGFLAPLREWFASRAGAERVVQIFGCGVASSTTVDVWRIAKTNPPRRDQSYFDQYGRPVVIVTGNPRFDIVMVQGKFTENGQGMTFLRAIAECTGAAVQAPIHMESNFPPYFRYELGSVWVYPNKNKDYIILK